MVWSILGVSDFLCSKTVVPTHSCSVAILEVNGIHSPVTEDITFLHPVLHFNFQTYFWPWLLPWSLHPAGGDSSKPWSSGLFRFFDICCSLFEWWIYPPLSRYVLITQDTFNQQDIKHTQQSGGGEKRNANKYKSHSFRSTLYMSSFQRAVCAKLPCGGQPSIWRRSEAWSRSALDSAIGQDVSPQTVRDLFLLTNEKYLQLKWFVDHMCRGLCLNHAQMEITHWGQLVDPRLYLKKKWFSSLRMVLLTL